MTAAEIAASKRASEAEERFDLDEKFARSWLWALVAAVAAACAQPRDDLAHNVPSGCSVRVIVGLAGAPDAGLLGDLSRASGARLELVRTMTSGLHLLSLEAAGPDSECMAAIEKLRSDARVRSVDLDTRRTIQEP
jgi:hypothetical protein